jgi:hypothetical protein
VGTVYSGVLGVLRTRTYSVLLLVQVQKQNIYCEYIYIYIKSFQMEAELMANSDDPSPPTINAEEKPLIWQNDFIWIRKQLEPMPIWTRNLPLCQTVLNDILPKWYQDLNTAKSNNPWTKIRKRIAKELNECEPCLEYVIHMVENSTEGETFTIADICSGFGLCSMLLAELLPPGKVDKIWLIDKQWPHKETLPQHITTEHIYGRNYPIPLRIRKMDMKKSREIKQVHTRVLDPAPGPVIMIGIHLCKALSVHAIKLYQASPKAAALILKPCCLPGAKFLYVPSPEGRKTPIQYDFVSGYSFRPLDIYQDCEEVHDDDDGDVPGESPISLATNTHQDKNFTNKRYSAWVNCLSSACESETSTVEVKHIDVMKHHFLNQFIFCQTIKNR